MGANAATDTIDILDRVWTILSMEWIAAIRSIEMSERISPEAISDLSDSYRDIYPSSQGDNVLAEEIQVAEKFLRDIIIEDKSFLKFRK